MNGNDYEIELRQNFIGKIKGAVPKNVAFHSSKETEAVELLLTYRPDYFVSGHSHQFPYFPGNNATQIANGVNVLVPGQLLSAPFPNHIVLNTVSKEAAWETSSREWIPEDRLYDYLVLKFP